MADINLLQGIRIDVVYWFVVFVSMFWLFASGDALISLKQKEKWKNLEVAADVLYRRIVFDRSYWWW